MSDWRELRTTTWSMVALIFMVAFESLAVTTVMPTVSDALDGASLYAFAFAGPLATGVVGMVAGRSVERPQRTRGRPCWWPSGCSPRASSSPAQRRRWRCSSRAACSRASAAAR